jgi:hypothetical protein
MKQIRLSGYNKFAGHIFYAKHCYIDYVLIPQSNPVNIGTAMIDRPKNYLLAKIAKMAQELLMAG